MLKPSLAGAGRLLTILSLLVLASAASARADTTTLDGTDAPLVRIDITTGNVQVRTWDRPTVAIDAAPGALQIDRQHFSVPLSTVPILAGRVQGPDGIVTLPEESFAVNTLGPEPRDVVRITGRDPGPITVTIPNSTALLVVQDNTGNVAIHNFTNGTFVARVQRGRIRLDRDGGSGFVQVMRGPVLVNDSDFERLRSRTALGVTLFERCRARQIQATSVSGAIVYDHGTFDPGLARFQSESGAVAVGVDGPAQLGARGGRVFTSFGDGVTFQNRTDATATASVRGGGPEVMAASATGSVFLYDGSIRNRPNLGSEWNPVSETLRRDPEPALQADQPRFDAGRYSATARYPASVRYPAAVRYPSNVRYPPGQYSGPSRELEPGYREPVPRAQFRRPPHPADRRDDDNRYRDRWQHQ